jgi:hypothetical protein
MKKHNLLIPITLGITKAQWIGWADKMSNYFGNKNTANGIEEEQSFFVINAEITEEDVKFAENLLSEICKKPCDVVCIRGSEEAWDKVTEDKDLLILDL